MLVTAPDAPLRGDFGADDAGEEVAARSWGRGAGCVQRWGVVVR